MSQGNINRLTNEYTLFEATFRSTVSYLVVVSFFLTGNGFTNSIFTFYWYYPVYLVLIAYWVLAYRTINKVAIFGLSLMLLHSTLVLILHRFSGAEFMLKQVINIFFSTVVFAYFLRHEQYDIVEIFRKYCNVSKIVAIIGFVQVALFAVGAGDLFLKVFPFDSNISTRLQSVTLEPSFIAYTLCPVVFLSLYNLFNRRRLMFGYTWSLLFVLAYLLTISAVAMVALVFVFLVLYFNPFTLNRALMVVAIFSVMAGLVVLVYETVPNIRLRIDDTLYALSNDITKEEVYLNVNLSTYALLSNLYVTEHAVASAPLLGSGVGTYELAYDNILPEHMKAYWTLNRSDANSMAFRLMVETGIIGFLVVIYFLYRFRIKRLVTWSIEKEILWIINNGILIMILLWLVRSGHYSIHGRILFVLMYYYSYQYFYNDGKENGYLSDGSA